MKQRKAIHNPEGDAFPNSLYVPADDEVLSNLIPNDYYNDAEEDAGRHATKNAPKRNASAKDTAKLGTVGGVDSFRQEKYEADSERQHVEIPRFISSDAQCKLKSDANSLHRPMKTSKVKDAGWMTELSIPSWRSLGESASWWASRLGIDGGKYISTLKGERLAPAQKATGMQTEMPPESEQKEVFDGTFNPPTEKQGRSRGVRHGSHRNFHGDHHADHHKYPSSIPPLLKYGVPLGALATALLVRKIWHWSEPVERPIEVSVRDPLNKIPPAIEPTVTGGESNQPERSLPDVKLGELKSALQQRGADAELVDKIFLAQGAPRATIQLPFNIHSGRVGAHSNIQHNVDWARARTDYPLAAQAARAARGQTAQSAPSAVAPQAIATMPPAGSPMQISTAELALAPAWSRPSAQSVQGEAAEAAEDAKEVTQEELFCTNAALFAFSRFTQTNPSVATYQNVTFDELSTFPDCPHHSWELRNGFEVHAKTSGLFVVDYAGTLGSVSGEGIFLRLLLNDVEVKGSQHSTLASGTPVQTQVQELSRSLNVRLTRGDVLRLQFAGSAAGVALVASGIAGDEPVSVALRISKVAE